jgi:hypothetical protein
MDKKKTLIERGYAAAAYRKDKRRRGPLNLDFDEFLESVKAEAYILQHSPCTSGAKEVASSEPKTIQDHQPSPADEIALQRQAVSNAIRDARLPRRSRRPHAGLTSSDDVVCPGTDPLGSLIDAEGVGKQAALVRKAMKSVVKDGTDKAILRLLYYGSDEVNQAQVATKLGISPSCLSKRLSAVHKALREFIKREGTSI